LLVINLAVVFGLLLRPETTPDVASNQQNDSALALQAERPSFAEQVSGARQSPPPMQASPGQTVEDTAPVPPPVVTPRNRALIPNIHEVRANGTIVLPELRLDMHVYSDVPEDRFVFINMTKQREGARLPEGPVVAEITPEGVVLNYQGTLFLLPHD
jgi:general secretion pathway protein B